MLDEKSCDLKIQHREREVNVMRFSPAAAQITDLKMKLAEILPARHCLWPNQPTTRERQLTIKIASRYTAVGKDRFSLAPSEAEARPSVQQAG